MRIIFSYRYDVGTKSTNESTKQRMHALYCTQTVTAHAQQNARYRVDNFKIVIPMRNKYG